MGLPVAHRKSNPGHIFLFCAVMKEYHTCSLPYELFIVDKSVAIHWRMYAILNGFFINGKACFASNKWFEDKLGCSARAISDAVKVLENMRLIKCKFTRRSRTILTNISVEKPTEMEVEKHRDGNRVLSEMEVDFYPNSVSNSVSNSIADIPEDGKSAKLDSSEENGEITRIGPDGDDIVVKQDRRTKDKLAIYRLFSRDKQPWYYHKHEREAALRLFDMKGVDSVKKGVAAMREFVDDQYCPQAKTPYEYEKKVESLKTYLRRKKHVG